MWLYIHRPFEVWPIFGTIRLELCYVIFAIIAWVAISAKTWTSNQNNLALCFVAFSITISTLLSPYSGFGDNLATEKWFKVFLFFLLLMSSVSTEKDIKVLVTGFTICFTIYMLHSYREFLGGKFVYRMGTVRMVGVDASMNDPNSFGASINYAVCLLLPLLALAKEIKDKKWKRNTYLFCALSFCLSVLCIQLTGSRSSFAALVVSLAGLAMMSKHRFRILAMFLIACPIVWFSLTENLQNRYRSIWDPSYGTENAQTFEDRTTAGLYGGIAVWQDNMIFGVGPGCYVMAGTSAHQTHQLYGQILSELGSLGALAYLTLVFAVLLNHLDAHLLYNRMKSLNRENEALYLYRVSFGVTWAIVLLLMLGMGAHSAFRFTWIWYAAFQAISVELLRQKVDATVKADRMLKYDLRIKDQTKRAA